MERHGGDGMTIRELADLAGTTTRTIHYYASEGLLPPPQGAKRAATYSPAHLARLRLITALRDEGLSLAAIRNRLAPLDDARVLAVVEDINARTGDEDGSTPPLTTLGAIEAALAVRLSSVADDSDLVASMDASEPEEGTARMDVSRHPDIITPPTFSAPSPLSRRHDQTAVTDSHVPQPSHSGSAKDYIDRIRRNQAPDASTAGPLPVPSRRVPPPRPAQPPRATKTETPEAWYHFTIGDGIEMRVREDRYREAGGRLRAIVDAASNAARRYGLSPPDHPSQSKPD